jgi:hypothetical protein
VINDQPDPVDKGVDDGHDPLLRGCSSVPPIRLRKINNARVDATRPSTKIVYKALACTNAEDDIPDGRPHTSQVPCHRGPLAQWQS